MELKKLSEIMLWVKNAIASFPHCEVQLVFKVRDGKVVLVEKILIEKEKPE